jgi:methylated-DNA-protein-cysteine methyltransferase related protein
MLRLFGGPREDFFGAMTEREFRVLQRIRATPPGFVRTYGDVSPGAPRFAGTVLASTTESVPWWRVVRADGSLAKGERQRKLLDEEGVPFVGQRVDLRAARLPD